MRAAETPLLFPIDGAEARTPVAKRSTRREGLEHIRGAAPTIGSQIVVELAATGGATLQELAVALARKEASICGRLGELRRAGGVRDSGRTRVGTSGVRNIVWQLCSEGEK
jgi:hypothetical protein